MARTKETRPPARQMAGPCLHILDRDRSGGTVGVKRRDTQTTRRQARGARPTDFVSGKLIAIELKSRSGKCSPPQCAVREDLLRAGARGWWVCRTARAAMWALRKSGVKFRTRANDDGTLERWQSPRLPAWEVPKRNPHERRPRAPDYWEPGAAAEIAELAAASDDAAGDDIASLAASSAE